MESDARVGAVVLAGGRDRGPLADLTGQPIRALVPIHGRPMVAYVAGALAASSRVGTVVSVGPDELAGALPGVRVVPEGAGLLENIRLGLEALATDGPVLLVTCDIPFLTPAALDDFIGRALSAGADVCYPIISETANAARFPGMKRTYARLREGRFTGGNMMLVRAGFFSRMESQVADAYALRKKPLRLARRIGPSLLVALVLGQLRVARVETRIGKILQGTVRAIPTDYAEIGADVDKPVDLQAAEALLAPR